MSKASSIGGVWRFERGRCWALLGDDSAAKSRLCRIVAGEEPVPRGMSVVMDEGMEERVRLVSFAQQRAAARKGGFLQARYYSLVDDSGPDDTVADVLSFNRVFDVNPFEVGRPRLAERRAYAVARRRIMPILRIRELMDRPFLALSNGETRRVLLAHAILSCPALLVLDDPCAGLDPERRDELKRLLDTLATQGTALLLSLRHEDEIPSCVTEVFYLGRDGQGSQGYQDSQDYQDCQGGGMSVPSVVELRDIRISFGRRKLFDGFSWTVRRGEHWVLQGPNGSGKTTLLALITGDSPLAYANDVTVFGVRRAPGTELAKVRRRIGMVSPEQQAYLGLGADELLEVALRKNPDLLLLDEPCLNLDAAAARRLRSRVARYLSSRPYCTAICVAHRPDDIPPGFGMSISLG